MSDESIFAEALGKAPGHERRAFLDEACGGNDALHRCLERLLEADDQTGGILERGPADPPPTGEQTGASFGPYKPLPRIRHRFAGTGSAQIARRRLPTPRPRCPRGIDPCRPCPTSRPWPRIDRFASLGRADELRRAFAAGGPEDQAPSYQVSDLGVMAARPTELTDHFDPDCRARGRFGDSCCTSDPVYDLQHAVRPLVNPKRRHPQGGVTEACDLALQLVRISPRQTGRWQPELGGINIGEICRHHNILSVCVAARKLRAKRNASAVRADGLLPPPHCDGWTGRRHRCWTAVLPPKLLVPRKGPGP
jgi:hypothetical protein